MPQLELYLVDWKEAQESHARGTLQEDLQSIFGDSKDAAKWAKSLDWSGKQPADYFDIADLCEGLERPEEVSEEAHEAAMGFLNVLITYQDYHNDFEGGEGDCLLAISPESAAHFSELVKDVDFSVYRSHFDEFGPEFDVETDDALKFFKLWVKIINDAAKQKKGFIAILE